MPEHCTDSVWLRYEQSVAEALDRHHYFKASSVLKEALEAARSAKTTVPNLLERADVLADLYTQQGDFQNAASLYRLTLEVKKNAFGPKHPDVERTLQAFMKVLSAAGGLTPQIEKSLSKF